MLVHPISLCLVIDPIALVEVAIGMYQPATAIGFVILPVALVYASIRPNLDALAFPLAGQLVPLPLVESATFSLAYGSALQFPGRRSWSLELVGSPLLIDFKGPSCCSESHGHPWRLLIAGLELRRFGLFDMLQPLSGHVASEVCLNAHDEIDVLQVILRFRSLVNFGDHELLAVLART